MNPYCTQQLSYRTIRCVGILMSAPKPKGAPVSTEIQPPGVSINADVHYAHLSVKKSFAGKNVFVTGATGFLGKCVVEKLLRSVCDVF